MSQTVTPSAPFVRLFALALYATTGCITGLRAAPAAPSNLRVAVRTTTSIDVIWDDNSTDETHFELAYSVNDGGAFTRYPVTSTSTAGTGTTGVSFSGLTAGTKFTWKVRAYTTTNANASAYSNTAFVNLTAFNPPNSPIASLRPDGSVLFMWTDNAAAEGGYSVEYASNNGAYSVYGTTDASFTGILIDHPAPDTIHWFRARAFQGTATNPVAWSAYSPAVSVSTPAMVAPTGLTATNLAPHAETSVKLTLNDNTPYNTGYAFEYRVAGQESFAILGDAGDVTSVNATDVLIPGTSYEFRVRAFHEKGSSRVYSAYSNIAGFTTPFNPPTNLAATPSAGSPYAIDFTWTDNSAIETGYELQYRKPGEPFTQRKVIAANPADAPNPGRLARLPEFDPGTVYEFRIRALFSLNGTLAATSAFSPVATATTPNGFSSRPYAPITQGIPFQYQLATLSQPANPRTGWTVGTLPAGLSFDPGTGIISGKPAVAGLFDVPLTATFSGGSSQTLHLMLRILRPPGAPHVTTPIGPQSLAQGQSTSIALGTTFADPDTDLAVRVATTKGNLDIILHQTLTPATVANFLAYNSRGDYNGTLFHRAPAGFVIQGGGYRDFAAPDVFEAVAAQAPVANEPGISNLAGTIAMAKRADDPDSATSEFFFSLGDNASNLDNQNGGFTVFGRVATPSLSGTLTTLANVPVADYFVKLRDAAVTPATPNFQFTDLPVDSPSPPQSIDQSRLLRVTSISPLPVLTYSITSPPDPAVATATVTGSNLQITAVAPGTTSLQVTATDVDGNATPQTVPVSVNLTFAQWANGWGWTSDSATTTADPDHDGHSNLWEYAFVTNPTQPDGGGIPGYALTPPPGPRHLELTFPVRKFTQGLIYRVEASDTMADGSWSRLWSSADGFHAPAVQASVDAADRTIVTVRDTQASPPATRRFLRVVVHLD